MKKVITASVLALALSACANSALMVERPYRGDYRTTTAQIEFDDTTVGVAEDDIAYTQRRMEEAFFAGDAPMFARGDGVTVRYRYVGFDEGSRMGRWLAAGLAGASKVVLEADFISPQGEVLATVRGEGTVSGGPLGGSSRTGIDKAIDEVASYASARFRR